MNEMKIKLKRKGEKFFHLVYWKKIELMFYVIKDSNFILSSNELVTTLLLVSMPVIKFYSWSYCKLYINFSLNNIDISINNSRNRLIKFQLLNYCTKPTYSEIITKFFKLVENYLILTLICLKIWLKNCFFRKSINCLVQFQVEQRKTISKIE